MIAVIITPQSLVPSTQPLPDPKPAPSPLQRRCPPSYSAFWPRNPIPKALCKCWLGSPLIMQLSLLWRHRAWPSHTVVTMVMDGKHGLRMWSPILPCNNGVLSGYPVPSLHPFNDNRKWQISKRSRRSSQPKRSGEGLSLHTCPFLSSQEK